MKTKLTLTRSQAKRSWLRVIQILVRRNLRRINDDKLIIVLGSLIFLVQLLIIVTAVAGERMPKSESTDFRSVPSTALTIGDQVPDVVLSGIINYKMPTPRISDFKGKVLILDFWATWCTASFKNLPAAERLQKQFRGKVQFITVTEQSAAAVETFLQKETTVKRPSLPLVAADSILHSLFPHRLIPHYVWIGPDGRVAAFTEFKDITAANIQQVLDGEPLTVRMKIDEPPVPYDRAVPLLVGDNGGDGSTLFYHTAFTRYSPGLGSSFEIKTDSIRGRKITALNQGLAQLYQHSFRGGGKYFNKKNTKLEVANPGQLWSDAHGYVYGDWLRENAYCYEVIVPYAQRIDALKIMQADLARMFPRYSAKVELVSTKCLVLRRTSNTDKLKSAGGERKLEFDRYGCTMKNVPLNPLVERLNMVYLQSTPFTVVNDTGYRGPVDISLTANLSQVAEINRQLERYDLKLEEQTREIEMLVIRDKN